MLILIFFLLSEQKLWWTKNHRAASLGCLPALQISSDGVADSFFSRQFEFRDRKEQQQLVQTSGQSLADFAARSVV